MSEMTLGASTTSARLDNLESIALQADTQLRDRGRAAGGAFSRMLVVPEYYFNAGSNIISRDDKHRIYKKLQSISANVPDLIFIAGSIAYGKGIIYKDTYSVCPILYNGNIVQKLYKADDDGVYQINGSFKTKNDGGKGVPVVTINGITIGLDICMDYNNNRLGAYLQTNDLNPPDIHIQISGTNAMSTPSARAKVGGVYVHCDLGGKGANGATAWRITAQNGLAGARSTQIRPFLTFQPGAGRLMFFDTNI